MAEPTWKHVALAGIVAVVVLGMFAAIVLEAAARGC